MKTALITGGSSGIGAESAVSLAKAGFKVFINYHSDKESADSVCKEIKKEGGHANIVKADVTDPVEVKAMFEKTGHIDVLFNNAHCKVQARAFDKMSWDEVRPHIEMSIKSTFLCSQEAVKGMKENKYGKIINNVTSYAHQAPPSGLAHYVSAKSGLLGLTKSMAVDLAKYGICVNSISPGVTDTPLNAHLPDAFKEMIANNIPLKRIATPKDIAGVVLFLASENSDYLTGVDIPICGGSIMQ